MDKFQLSTQTGANAPLGVIIVMSTDQERRLRYIDTWPHWPQVQQLAEREYHISRDDFDRRLVEYKRFMGLIVLGYGPLNLLIPELDHLWHVQVLYGPLTFYPEFCLRAFGYMIDHLPKLGEAARVDTNDPRQVAAALEKRRKVFEAYEAVYAMSPPTRIWGTRNSGCGGNNCDDWPGNCDDYDCRRGGHSVVEISLSVPLI